MYVHSMRAFALLDTSTLTDARTSTVFSVTHRADVTGGGSDRGILPKT